MATASTAASHQIARRSVCLAVEAESRLDLLSARRHYLEAVRFDPTPESGLAFGCFLSETGQTDDAVLVLQDCWQLAKRRASWLEVAACCRALAKLFRKLGQVSQARRFLQRAAAAEMSGWSAEQAALSSEQLLVESEFAERDGDLSRAVALVKSALEGAEGVQRSMVLRHHARLFAIQGQPRVAALELVAAARVARASANDRAYADCLLDLGHILRGMRWGRTAIGCYREAAVCFERGGRPMQAGVARRWLRETAAIERAAGGDPCWN